MQVFAFEDRLWFGYSSRSIEMAFPDTRTEEALS